MNTDNLKYVIGEAKTGEIATIRFFDKINKESTTLFNSEFDFLENCIKPSLIRVLINSEGGSVLYGMSTYSTIQNSKIPTECIIEGMAASMASVIWAAGTKSWMRDYSILMIHNPFLPNNDEGEPSDLVLAFTQQIKTIYRKRFGLTKDHVDSIMNGEMGRDGTFFTAKAAIKAGIIPTENVIRTSKQLCDKVKNELGDNESSSNIQAIMTRICAEAPPLTVENKHLDTTPPILEQTDNNTNSMNENKTMSPDYAAVAASLGMHEQFEVKDVMARVSKLISVEAKYIESEKALKDANTVIAGKEATIGNLQKNNTELTEALNTYKTKEADIQKAKIDQLVEAAITDGKIELATKAGWVEMATSNFALAQSTLNSIPVREQISKEIASDPDNVTAAANASKSTENELATKVEAVVGKEFEFKKIG